MFNNITLSLNQTQFGQVLQAIQQIGTQPDICKKLDSMQAALQSSLDHITQGEKQIMAGITDIQTAQAAEKADLAALGTQITALLSAFASGTMTPAQAQALLDEITSQDATIKTQMSAIQAALPPAAPVAP